MKQANIGIPASDLPLTGIAADSLPLDPGIDPAVRALRAYGVLTIESCQGGEGHAFPEPTIVIAGNWAQATVLAAARDYALPVRQLRRVWSIIDGELTGPQWEIVLRPPTG